MKVIVAHPAQQHSYRLAAALEQAGMLERYITTVYDKPRSLTRLAARLLRGDAHEKAQGRRCPELPDDAVVQFCEGEGLLKLLAMRLPLLRRFYRPIKYHTADRFARKVAAYAARIGADAVVCYDDCSSVLFPELERRAPEILRIMDVSAANVLYMREIYERDMALQPAFADRLRAERKIVWDPDTVARTERELASAQLFLAPSQFVAQSLEFSGITPERIRLCPYGVDAAAFAQKDYPDYTTLGRPLRFIYVGGAKELKGISYLLQAFAAIPPEQAELTVVGAYDRSAPELQPYLDRVTFTGSVLHSRIPALLREADVFVFPSLGEGQSLSVLEAAAVGLPLIVSENAGVREHFADGDAGFVIPIQSDTAIREKAEWFVRHADQIPGMGRTARRTALRLTWDAYSARVREIFEEVSAVPWGD